MGKNKKVTILGAGESGVGAALLAKALGYRVFVSDFGGIQERYKVELGENDIPFEENQHNEKKILKSDLIIKSPGIPYKAPILKKIRAKSIEIYGEIEFAYRHKSSRARIVAITGSNGKTTTTLLLYHLLRSAGLPVYVGGNVGESFARLVMQHLGDNTPKTYVLELSSFQLDDSILMRANTAILLNITPDHLDRYDYLMENYVASKFQIAYNQKTTGNERLN